MRQGEGAKADFVKKHELAVPDGSMRFMGLALGMEDLSKKESPSKGDVWQVAVKNGRHTIYPLYVYDGSDWAPFMQKYKLTVKLPDGTSKTYDGQEAVTVDLSKFATADDLDELKKTIVTVDQLDGFATWKDGNFTLLGQKISDHSVHFRTPQGNWADTGVKLGTDAGIYNVSRVSGSQNTLRFSGKDVGLARNGGTSYYRANPLVLAVRLVDIDGLNTAGNTCTVGYLYNPYNLSVMVSDVNSSAGYYQLTHNMYTKGLVTKKSYNSNGGQDDMFSYVVMGTAHAYNSVHPLFVTAISCRGDSFTFTTSDDNTPNAFETCNIMIYDFSTL